MKCHKSHDFPTIEPDYFEQVCEPIEVTDLSSSAAKFVYPRHAPASISVSTDDLLRTLSAHEMASLYARPWDSPEEIMEGVASAMGKKYSVVNTDTKDLSVEFILDTLQMLTRKLMVDSAMIDVNRILCTMTPQTKEHLLKANAKRKMYGKESVIVPHFDRHFRRIDDEIHIDTKAPMIIKIVDPKDRYGHEYFLELEATR